MADSAKEDGGTISPFKHPVQFFRAELHEIEFDWRPTLLVLVFLCVLLAPLYIRERTFMNRVGNVTSAEFAQALHDHGVTFRELLRTVVPIATIFIMRHRLRDYGLGLGNVRAGLALTAFAYAIFIPCFILLVTNEGIREYYGGVARRHDTWFQFFRYEGSRTLAVMIGTEFFFRGFLLFTFKRYYGVYAAILASLIPYVFGHYPKVVLEAYGSIPVGLGLAWIAVKTNSIWYGVLLHTTIALGISAAMFWSGTS